MNPGERLHKYTIIRELGRGGMGGVYVGEEDVTGRQFAIKTLFKRENLIISCLYFVSVFFAFYSSIISVTVVALSTCFLSNGGVPTSIDG